MSTIEKLNPVEFLSEVKAPSLTVGGDAKVSGNLIVSGETIESSLENVTTPQNTITLRKDAEVTLLEGEYTGLIAEKYDGNNNGMLVFDNTGTAYVGDEGDLQPLATRAPFDEIEDGHLLTWNATQQKLVDGGSLEDVLKFDENNSLAGPTNNTNDGYAVSLGYENIAIPFKKDTGIEDYSALLDADIQVDADKITFNYTITDSGYTAETNADNPITLYYDGLTENDVTITMGESDEGWGFGYFLRRTLPDGRLEVTLYSPSTTNELGENFVGDSVPYTISYNYCTPSYFGFRYKSISKDDYVYVREKVTKFPYTYNIDTSDIEKDEDTGEYIIHIDYLIPQTEAADYASIALGYVSVSGGMGAISAGYRNVSLGNSTFTGGYHNKSLADAAATFGSGNINKGKTGFVCGHTNTLGGGHANILAGSQNTIQGGSGHAVFGMENTITAQPQWILCSGYRNTVTGNGGAGFVTGRENTVNGPYGQAGGLGCVANQKLQRVFGQYNIIDNSNKYVDIIGWGTDNNNRANLYTLTKESGDAWFKGAITCGANALVCGYENTVNGDQNVVGGYKNNVTSSIAAVFGSSNISQGMASATLGYSNTNTGKYAIVAGNGNNASGEASITLGLTNTNKGKGSFVVGEGNINNNGGRIIVAGRSNTIDGIVHGSAIFGCGNIVKDGGSFANAESAILCAGKLNTVEARVGFSSVIGHNNTLGTATNASNIQGNAVFGGYNTLVANYSFISGSYNTIDNNNIKNSFVAGTHCYVGRSIQRVFGQYNVINTASDAVRFVDIVGWGTSDTDRKNIYTLDTEGNAAFTGTVTANGRTLATKEYIDVEIQNVQNSIGDIEAVLDEIIELQNGLIGGDTV